MARSLVSCPPERRVTATRSHGTGVRLSASDVYSAGVAMLEVWVGDLWETSEEGADEADGASDEEEDDEDFEATRKQVLAGLEKMSGAEAEVGSILA
eukprot:2205716-Rhodomonas_salina.1